MRYNTDNTLFSFERVDKMKTTNHHPDEIKNTANFYTPERLLIALCLRPEQEPEFYALVLNTTAQEIRQGFQALKRAKHVQASYTTSAKTSYELSDSGSEIFYNAKEGRTEAEAKDYRVVELGIAYADEVLANESAMKTDESANDRLNELAEAYATIDKMTKRLEEAEAEARQLRGLLDQLTLTPQSTEIIRTLSDQKASALNQLASMTNRALKAEAEARNHEQRAERAEEALKHKQAEYSKYIEKHPRHETERANELNDILEAVKKLVNTVVNSQVSHGEKNATLRALLRMIDTEQKMTNRDRIPF